MNDSAENTLQIGGPRGAICLKLLVLYHNIVWSTQKGMSTFQRLGAKADTSTDIHAQCPTLS